MATSGSFTGSRLARGSHFYGNWGLSRQDIAGNYTTIWWNCGIYFNQEDAQLDNGYCSFNGEVWRVPGRVKPYEGNISTRHHQLASGSKNIYHDNIGNQTLSGAGGITVFNGRRTEGNGSWGLPQIPRTSEFSLEGFDEKRWGDNSWKPAIQTGKRFTVRIHRATPSFTHSVEFKYYTVWGEWQATQLHNGVGDHITIDFSADYLAPKFTNEKELWCLITVNTYLGGTFLGTRNASVGIFMRGLEPEFDDFDIEDINDWTKGIGNNQRFINLSWANQQEAQDKCSNIRVKIPNNKKARPKHNARIVRYEVNFWTYNRNIADGDNLSVDIGRLGYNGSISYPNNITQDNIAVRAVDSRGFSKTVSKTIHISQFRKPEIYVSATRKNNYENETTVKLSGMVYPMWVSNRDVQQFNLNNGVQYRYRQSGGTWSSWTSNTVSKASNGKITCPDFILNLNSSYAYDIEAKIIDRLGINIISSATITEGVAVMRIGTDGHIYNNEQPLMPSHIGMILETVSLDTPEKVSVVYGGKWVVHAPGRVIVGVGSNGTTNYPTANMTAGADRVTLSVNEMPSHDHTGLYWNNQWHVTLNGGSNLQNYSMSWGRSGYADSYRIKTGSAGGGQSHENRMPLSTAYRWRRVL